MVGILVMAPKSVTFRRHDHLVSVLFGDLFSHSYNITFSMFLYLVILGLASKNIYSGVVASYGELAVTRTISKKAEKDAESLDWLLNSC